MNSTTEIFRSAMNAAGIEYTGEIFFDSKLRRFKAEGDDARNSWYVVHPGPPAAGAFGCWKRGLNESWCDRSSNLSQADWQRIRQRWHEAEVKAKAETVALQKKARRIADWILPRAKPVTTHAYLSAKQVQSHGELKEYRSALALPLRDLDGKLHSLQFVGADGSKNFLTGGRVAGCFFTLADKADGPLVICEGYATGASIHEVTGHSVICAINSGNLLDVAKEVRELWPEREIIIAADNDQWTTRPPNPGLTKATAAAKAIHAKLAVPQFKDTANKPTDFNDLATAESLDAVKKQIGAAEIPAETDADTFARLAALSPAEYDRCRETEAAALRLRVKTLDEEIERLRSRIGKAESSYQPNPTAFGRTGHLLFTPSKWFSKRFPLLADEYGDAILEKIDEKGIISAGDICEDFLAATLGDKGSPNAPTIFLPTEEKFYTYFPIEGIFLHRREPAFLTQLSRLLLQCARECQDCCDTCSLEFRFRDSANLSGVIKKARGLLEVPHDFFSTDLADFIPCANGMLRLKDKKLLPFSPSYCRRNKLAVSFDPSATCSLFLDTLMRPALDAKDLDLLQRWCGLALIGENLAQVILILIGTAGGGKGTFIRVLTGIIGQMNLASLRPQLLGERFELGRFLGRTLLYGADVPANFLDQRGVSVLKSLTGYDPVTLEFKNSNESPSIICRFNAIATCNSRLVVHLEGDVEAWRRRLRIIEYRNPKPEKIIADLDRQILEREASGVLNWMLAGLDKLRADSWQLRLTANQQAAVDNLLLESDGHAVFVRECLKRDTTQTLTVPDCFAAYVEFCTQRGWAALTRNKFTMSISDEVVRQFGVTPRHDIPDAKGKPQRGWKGLACAEKFVHPTDETVSESSANDRSDTSDTLFSIHPQKISTGGKPELVEEFI